MSKLNGVNEIYEHFRKGKKREPYNEEKHCKMLIATMLDPDRGTVESFCVEAMITDRTFRNWRVKHELFDEMYHFSKMVAREKWDDQGRKIRDADYPMGTVNYEFEYWKMIGWTRFGVSRNARLKIRLDPDATPESHYRAILKQASEGDFTASEFKQMMEAVNVGLNVHQVIELQKQIDSLKSDLAIMRENTDVHNPFSDPPVAKADTDTVEDKVCGQGNNA